MNYQAELSAFFAPVFELEYDLIRHRWKIRDTIDEYYEIDDDSLMLPSRAVVQLEWNAGRYATPMLAHSSANEAIDSAAIAATQIALSKLPPLPVGAPLKGGLEITFRGWGPEYITVANSPDQSLFMADEVIPRLETICDETNLFSLLPADAIVALIVSNRNELCGFKLIEPPIEQDFSDIIQQKWIPKTANNERLPLLMRVLLKLVKDPRRSWFGYSGIQTGFKSPEEDQPFVNQSYKNYKSRLGAESQSRGRDGISQGPDDPEGWYQLGIAAPRTADCADRLTAFRQALKLEPTHLAARGQLIMSLQSALEDDPENPELAAELERELITLGQQDPASLHRVQHNLARLYGETGRYADAVAAYEKSPQTREDARLHMAIAQALDERGEEEFALIEYLKSLELSERGVRSKLFRNDAEIVYPRVIEFLHKFGWTQDAEYWQRKWDVQKEHSD